MRERHFAEYRKMVEADDDLARYALEEVQRIDAEREAQSKVIAQAEAVVSEWTGPPDLDAALDFYRGLTDLVNGKVREARGAKELNDALHEVLAGIWASIHTGPINTGRLQAAFESRVPADGERWRKRGLAEAMGRDLKGRKFLLPEVDHDGRDSVAETERALAIPGGRGRSPARSPRAGPRSARWCPRARRATSTPATPRCTAPWPAAERRPTPSWAYAPTCAPAARAGRAWPSCASCKFRARCFAR